MIMGGTRETELVNGKSERNSLIPWLLAIGLIVYVAGVVIYSYGWHKAYYFNLGEDITLAPSLMALGRMVQISGLILVILGLVFFVAGILKGVPRRSLTSLVLGVLAYGVGAFIHSLGSFSATYRYSLMTGGPWPLVDRATAFKLMEWGRWAEGAGVALIILGLLLYMVGRRKVGARKM